MVLQCQQKDGTILYILKTSKYTTIHIREDSMEDQLCCYCNNPARYFLRVLGNHKTRVMLCNNCVPKKWRAKERSIWNKMNKKEKEEKYMKSGEAASFLGCTKNTLYNWEVRGKLVPYRINNYRAYKLADLKKFVKTKNGWKRKDVPSFSPNSPTPE